MAAEFRLLPGGDHLLDHLGRQEGAEHALDAAFRAEFDDEAVNDGAALNGDETDHGPSQREMQAFALEKEKCGGDIDARQQQGHGDGHPDGAMAEHENSHEGDDRPRCDDQRQVQRMDVVAGKDAAERVGMDEHQRRLRTMRCEAQVGEACGGLTDEQDPPFHGRKITGPRLVLHLGQLGHEGGVGDEGETLRTPVVDRHLAAVIDRDVPNFALPADADVTRDDFHGIRIQPVTLQQGLEHEAGENAAAAAHDERNAPAGAIRPGRAVHEADVRAFGEDLHGQQARVVTDEPGGIAFETGDSLGVPGVVLLERRTPFQDLGCGGGDRRADEDEGVPEGLIAGRIGAGLAED